MSTTTSQVPAAAPANAGSAPPAAPAAPAAAAQSSQAFGVDAHAAAVVPAPPAAAAGAGPSPAAAPAAAVTSPAPTAPDAAAAAMPPARTNAIVPDAVPAADAAPAPDPGPAPSYQLTAPAGMDAAVSKGLMDRAVAFAAEHRLAPEAAQKLLDRDAAQATAQAKAMLDHAKAAYNQQWDAYEAAAKADPEIGGHKYQETVRLAQRAVAQMPKGLQDLLRTTSAGAHPDVVRYLAAQGRKLMEAAPITGSTPPKQPSDIELFYGDTYRR